MAGWFRVPEERLLGEVPRLAVAWGGTRREVVLRRLRERRDLLAEGDLPAGRGFHVLLEAPETDEPATAFLLLGEESVTLNPAVLQPAPFRPRGGMDEPNLDGVRGWVLDAPGEQPSLLLEGCHPIPVPLTLHRPDLPFDNGADKPLFGFHLPLEALAGSLRQDAPDVVLFDGQPHELVLAASGVELARRTLAIKREMIGKLEQTGQGEAVGWLAEVGRPQDPQTVDLVLDGTRWATVQANVSRPDLAKVGIAYRGGGFRIPLPRLHPGDGGQLRIAAVPHHMVQPLPGDVAQEDLPAWRKDRGDVAYRLAERAGVAVSVVVPIFNAAAELDRCVRSVVRHTRGAARLILVDDASDQPEVADVLRRWEGTPGIEVHRNAENLGFTRTANHGLALAGRDDVVLLNSDTVVGPGWLDGLRAAAHSGPRTGTATAVSDNAGAFSVPEINAHNRMPPWFGVDEMARLVRGSSLSLLPAVPTGHGFCLYLRRDCLDQVGTFDDVAFPRGYGEENDFCMRAARAGFENVLDDRTFVLHRRSASFGAEKVTLEAAGRGVLAERYPEYRTLTSMFQSDPAMLAVRWRVRRAMERGRSEGATPRPRVLFVISTESGGTPQTNRDLMDALSDRYEPWVLRCDSLVLTLARHRPGGAAAGQGADDARDVVQAHRLERPIEPALHRSGEYDRVVADMILRHGFELVHVRHISWHGLGLIETCGRLGVPVVFSFHDFYTVCPTTKLLEAQGHFCGGDCTVGEGECRAELWSSAAVPPLRHRFVHRWRAMMEEALRACDAFVTTSSSARKVLLSNFPFLAERDFRLIPHGRSFPRMEVLAAVPTLDERLRVLVPGNVSASKGDGLVAAMAALDGGREVEFHVLGAVDRSLDAVPGLILHGPYDRADFAAHVARIRPHVGAILSLWPETYCHTLTECWAAGLPVVATALGALAERIEETSGGWLVDRWTPPERMLAVLRRLRRDPASVRARRDAVLDWQAGSGRHRDAVAMAVEYDRLYREVMGRRRSFAAKPSPPRVVLMLDRAQDALPTPLAVATRNAVSRPFIFRRILPSFPFGDPAAGSADAVLVAPEAIAPDDLAGLCRHCAGAGLPVIHLAGADSGDGLFVGHGLDAADWLSDAPRRSASPPRKAGEPCRVLFAFDGDEGMLTLLRPVFEDLSVLGVATLTVIDAPARAGAWFKAVGSAGTGGVATLRGMAGEHEIGLARPGPGLLAMQAAGLPVLAVPLAFSAEGPPQVGAAQEVLLRQIAELAVDAPQRAALAQEGLRAARMAILERPVGYGIDARITEMLVSYSGAVPA